jgi:hypothetical protein
MTTTHVIEATVCLLLMAANYGLFFRRNFRNWLRERGPRRERARREALHRAAEQRRLCDELAAKYPLPPPR